MGPDDMLRRQNLNRLRGIQNSFQNVPSQLTNLDANRLRNSTWTEREDNQEEQPQENTDQTETSNQSTEENTNQQNDSF